MGCVGTSEVDIKLLKKKNEIDDIQFQLKQQLPNKHQHEICVNKFANNTSTQITILFKFDFSILSSH